MKGTPIARTLLIFVVWLTIGIGVFGTLDSYGRVPLLVFAIAWLLLLRYSLIQFQRRILRLKPQETFAGRLNANGITIVKSLILITVIGAWTAITMIAVSVWPLSSQMRTVVWIVSALALVLITYGCERMWSP